MTLCLGKVASLVFDGQFLVEAHIQINLLSLGQSWTSRCLPQPTACLCPSGIEDLVWTHGKYVLRQKSETLCQMIFLLISKDLADQTRICIIDIILVGARDLGGLVG